ncbi:MAG: DUF2505 domain-containing protein [Nostocoides sp.]
MMLTTSGEFAAPCDQVFAIIGDTEFQTSIADTPGSSAAVATRGDRTVVTSHRVLPTDDLPDFVRTFVGSHLKLTEVQDWGPAAADGSRSGVLTLTIDDVPIRLDGTLSLSPAGSGSVQSVTGELRARIPLVGGKVEQSAAPALKAGIELEFAAIRQRL